MKKSVENVFPQPGGGVNGVEGGEMCQNRWTGESMSSESKTFLSPTT